MKFLSAYNFSLSNRCGRNNLNVYFLSRFPIPPTEEGISGSSVPSDLGNLGVYLIRVCGLTT